MTPEHVLAFLQDQTKSPLRGSDIDDVISDTVQAQPRYFAYQLLLF